MGYNGDEDNDLPDAPPITMVTETFSEVKVTPESSTQTKDDKE